MPDERIEADPYAPPPRHKERSGAVVRIVILCALLAAAAWGYVEYGQGPGLVGEAPQSEQVMADTRYDNSILAPPPAAAPQAPQPTPGAPPSEPPSPAG